MSGVPFTAAVVPVVGTLSTACKISLSILS